MPIGGPSFDGMTVDVCAHPLVDQLLMIRSITWIRTSPVRIMHSAHKGDDTVYMFFSVAEQTWNNQRLNASIPGCSSQSTMNITKQPACAAFLRWNIDNSKQIWSFRTMSENYSRCMPYVGIRDAGAIMHGLSMTNKNYCTNEGHTAKPWSGFYTLW